jgi:N-methylhydantoinase B
MMLHDAPDKKIQVVAFGVAGLRNSGHGTCGGYPGAPAILAHIEDSEVRKVLAEDKLPDELEPLKGKKNLLDYSTFELRADDLLFLRCASGGGYGDPLEREPQDVVNDMVNGLVSRDTAANIYGVVIGEGHQLDSIATDRKRASLKRERQAKARLGSASIPPSRLPDKKQMAVRNPVQSYLEACTNGDASWIRCVRCGHVLCEAGRDWIDACSSAVFPPTHAGPLMEILRGKFLFKQWQCPSCGVSLKAGMVDGESAEGG